MRAIGIISAVIAFSLFGIAAPAYAQHGAKGGPKDQASQHDRGHDKAQRKQRKPQRFQEQRRVRHDVWQQHRAQNWESDHRTWQQRGGYQGYRVPESRYRRYFGPTHGFRINRLAFRVSEGQPRFQYRGYWFTLVDPWPEYWANDWYETDDVYVGSAENGYYLYNRRHPQFGVALRISL